jgi:hypothetical protein
MKQTGLHTHACIYRTKSATSTAVVQSHDSTIKRQTTLAFQRGKRHTTRRNGIQPVRSGTPLGKTAGSGTNLIKQFANPDEKGSWKREDGSPWRSGGLDDLQLRDGGAEGRGGGFPLSRLRQRAEGQTGRGGSWAAAGVGPGGGEDRDGEAGPAAALEP